MRVCRLVDESQLLCIEKNWWREGKKLSGWEWAGRIQRGQTASRVVIYTRNLQIFHLAIPCILTRSCVLAMQVQNWKEIQLNLKEIRLQRSPNVAKNGQANLLFWDRAPPVLWRMLSSDSVLPWQWSMWKGCWIFCILKDFPEPAYKTVIYSCI